MGECYCWIGLETNVPLSIAFEKPILSENVQIVFLNDVDIVDEQHF